MEETKEPLNILGTPVKDSLMGWGPLTLPATHPFTLGAELLHDPVYQAYLDGNASYPDLIRADEAYYSYMKGRAKELKSIDLEDEAKIFYGIIVAFRELCRRNPGNAPMPPQ